MTSALVSPVGSDVLHHRRRCASAFVDEQIEEIFFSMCMLGSSSAGAHSYGIEAGWLLHIFPSDAA